MTNIFDRAKVKVIPVRAVTHENYNDLIAIRGHQYYFVNLLSGKITYRRGLVRIPTGKNTIMAAKEYVEKRLKAMATGESEEKIEREEKGIIQISCKAAWDEMISSKKLGKAVNTVRNYNKSWTHGIDFYWGKKTALDVTNDNITLYKAAYLEKYPGRVFDQTYIHFGMLVRYMFKKQYIKTMPDLKEYLGDLDSIIRSNNQMEDVGRVLKPEEQVMILKGVEKYFEKSSRAGVSLAHKEMLYTRTKLAVLMGLKCGMRKMEILSRKWEEYLPKPKVMRVWSMKNKEWRDVPLIDEICGVLEKQRTFFGNSPYIFPMPSDVNRHISGQVFDKTWEQVKIHSGILGRLRFHDLRHSFATMTAELGMPPVIACEILDQSLDTYQRIYCKTSTTSKSEWMGKLFSSKKGQRR